jgi:hypothetical protein
MDGSHEEMNGASDQKLIERYEKVARVRGLAMNAGDSRSANRAFDEETSIREELRRRDPAAVRGLLSLLTSDDPWVRCDSAGPALFLAPQKAEPVLEKLVQSERGALKTMARFTLDQWHKGESTFQ